MPAPAAAAPGSASATRTASRERTRVGMRAASRFYQNPVKDSLEKGRFLPDYERRAPAPDRRSGVDRRPQRDAKPVAAGRERPDRPAADGAAGLAHRDDRDPPASRLRHRGDRPGAVER